MTKVPTLESGWQTMADGLFCHRYFLHIEPYRVAAVRDRLVSVWLGGSWDQLREGLPLAVLDNLVRTGNLTDAPRVAESVTEPTRIRGKQLAVVAEHPGPNGLPLVSSTTAKEGLRQLTEALGAEPFRLLCDSSLWYLIDFGIDLIVLLPPKEGYAPASDGDICIPGMLRVPLARNPIDFATTLIAQAAAHWLRLFALTDTTPITGHTGQGPGEPNPVAREVSERVLDTVARVVGVSAAHRLLVEEKVPDLGDVPSMREEELGANLRAVEQTFYSLTPLLPCLNAHDFAMTYFPGTRQYDKYRGGAGAGQAQ